MTQPIEGQLVTPNVRLVRPLGAGGMGAVWLADHLALRTQVVVKFMAAELASHPEAMGRFSREAAAAAQVKSPHVVQTFDHGVTGAGLPFIVMELLEGRDLEQELAATGPLPPARVANIVTQLARALGRAHERAIVHRDLKPANVFVSDAGGGEIFIKLLDFGIARGGVLDGLAPTTRTGNMIGTPHYMSPEQIMGAKDVGYKSDLWSLGVLAYEALTGCKPFDAETIGALAVKLHNEPPPRPSLKNAALPPEVDAWFLRACARDANDRFAGAAEQAAALSAALLIDGSASRREIELGPTAASARVCLPPPARPTLPAEPNAFLGRDEAIRDLGLRFDAGARLVTLLGIGGTGKTRLATRYGWSSLSRWPGGVWFCDLSDARSRDGVAFVVASSLDVPLGGEDPIAQLGHAIAGRGRCLLILDNFEQVTRETRATVGAWPDPDPGARGLGPPAEPPQPPGPLTPDEAALLFGGRACSVKPGFALARGEDAIVADLVRLLDNLPLAIELAAARVRLMTPAVLLARMSERFKLLAGTGDRRARQATLRGALDWSWDLLSEDERAALQQVSVFEGGFTLEAAEAVLSVGALWPMDAVQALVDKSLVRRVGPERFGLLVSVHAYAAEKLDASGGRADAEARHGVYYATFGQPAAVRALDASDGAARLGALAVDLENLRCASHRALSRGDAEVAADVALAAWAVVETRGPFQAGIAMLDAALEVAAVTGAREALLRAARAEANRWLGALEAAIVDYEAALAGFRAMGDVRAEVRVLVNYAIAERVQGRYAEALERTSGALTLARASGDMVTLCRGLANRGVLHQEQGRFVEARADLEAALEIVRSLGLRGFEGNVLSGLGVVCILQGNFDEARARWESGLAICRELGNRRGEGGALINLGELERLQGNAASSLERFSAALAINRQIGYRNNEAVAQAELGALHHEAGRRGASLACFAAGEALLRDIGDGNQLCLMLASRAKYESAADPARALADLAEAEALAAQQGGAADNEANRRIAKARAAMVGG